MKLKGWIMVAIIAAVVVFAYRSCGGGTAPDQKLAKHFDELCEIARHNIETPEKGVRKLGRYMGKHLDHVLGDFGATIAMIERTSDDTKHDERAELARRRLAKSLRACESDWMRFFEAVEADPEASEVVEHAAERLSRTLEIIFGSAAWPTKLRYLPGELERMVSPASP